MKNRNKLVSTAISSLLALSATAVATEAYSAGPPLEKCFGVVKAGKNDCGVKSLGTACQGTSSKDAQPDAYIDVIKGNCEKIVGGSLTAKK
ncbi:MAG TPA: DUF2282 domain-containing protein [Acidiferrobacteraceae bacterium]|nr:DUF2282 domain-containing protein [Acidiferrobacteraceae bacterium]